MTAVSVSYWQNQAVSVLLIMMFNSGNSQLQWCMVNERLTGRGEGLGWYDWMILQPPLHRWMF